MNFNAAPDPRSSTPSLVAWLHQWFCISKVWFWRAILLQFINVYIFLKGSFYFLAALHGMWNPISPTTDRASLCPLHWKHGVLTTGPPGMSPKCAFIEVVTSSSSSGKVLSRHRPWKTHPPAAWLDWIPTWEQRGGLTAVTHRSFQLLPSAIHSSTNTEKTCQTTHRTEPGHVNTPDSWILGQVQTYHFCWLYWWTTGGTNKYF